MPLHPLSYAGAHAGMGLLTKATIDTNQKQQGVDHVPDLERAEMTILDPIIKQLVTIDTSSRLRP